MYIVICLFLNAEQAGGDTEDEEEAEATKVTVKFSRANPAQGEKSGGKMSSYSARKKEEEEPWVDLEYVQTDPGEFDKLYTTKPDVPFYVLPKKEYLQSIFPKHQETRIDISSDKGNQQRHNPSISTQQMKKMTVPDQLRVLMTNGEMQNHWKYNGNMRV